MFGMAEDSCVVGPVEGRLVVPVGSNGECAWCSNRITAIRKPASTVTHNLGFEPNLVILGRSVQGTKGWPAVKI